MRSLRALQEVQIVKVLTGPPGSGKSHLMRETVLSQPGLYLVAVPSTELADELRDDYAKAAPSLWLRVVHYKDGAFGPVERKFAVAVEEITVARPNRAVIFITHESLLTLDLSNLTDWHLLIDEVPHVVRSGTLSVPISHDWLAATYGLRSIGRGWSVAVPRSMSAAWHVRKRDSLFGKIGEFDQEARRAHGVLVNTETWEQVAQRGNLDWISVWTPANLHCASVTIAGAGFFGSLAYRAAAWLHPDMRFDKQSIPARHRAVMPTLRLHYFVEAHRGSCNYWKTREGRAVLAQIRQFLSKLPALGFWSGNVVVEEQFDSVLPSESFVRPKTVIGSNALEKRTSCAFIYSAQAVPEDRPLMLFGLGKAEIEQSREFEDLYQFIMRGRLRDPNFGGIFDAYVYSRAQADEIARRVSDDGIANIEIVAHPEVGVMDVVRGKPKRPPTPEEVEGKKQKRRADDANRKRDDRQRKAALAGRSGKPGRPRKAAVPPEPRP